MLGTLKNCFLKSKIIPLSYQVDKTMVAIAKADLENYNEHFYENDAGKYNELIFYGKIAQKW
jgi:sulfate adenylyltransferase subunit 1 (EFTu-like GTPase family)